MSDVLMLQGRELDVLVARKVMGLKVKVEQVQIGTTTSNTGDAEPIITTRYNLIDENGDPIMTHGYLMHGYGPAQVPPYSTELWAAFQVQTHLEQKTPRIVCGERIEEGLWMKLTSPFDPYDSDLAKEWWAGFTPHSSITGWNGRADWQASGDTAPLAICRAALKSAEAMEKEAEIVLPAAFGEDQPETDAVRAFGERFEGLARHGEKEAES